MGLEFGLGEFGGLVACRFFQIDPAVTGSLYLGFRGGDRGFGHNGWRVEDFLYASFCIVASDRKHGEGRVHRKEYVLREGGTWHRLEPLHAADVHDVGGNVLVLVIARNTTERDRRFGLEG